jgi:tRNA A37 threonylcarbamoyladenosine synthetase subunit TsaC/SUA5/YrdC
VISLNMNKKNKPSTIVDLTGEKVEILREGLIPV